MSFQFSLDYGWGASPLTEQFDAYGFNAIDQDQAEHWQKDADALLRCVMRSLLPPSTVMKGRNKLTGKIEKYLVEHGHMVLSKEDAA